MSWVERYAEARKSQSRSRAIVARTRPLTIGVILAACGGYGLYSDTTHQINGRPATATLLERVRACMVEYQRIGEQRRHEPWPCDRADEFQRLAGSNKVKITRDFLARVRFPLEDGRSYEASVDESKLDSYKLPVGATLPIVFAPDNPADVRAELSWDRLKIPLGIFAVGLVFLALAIGNPLAALLAWAFRGRGDEETPSVSAEPLAAAATRVSEPRDGNRMPRRSLAPTNGRARAAVSGRASFGMRK